MPPPSPAPPAATPGGPSAPQSDLPSELRPRLLEVVRQTLRARHYSPRTEKSYVWWIKRFLAFHGMRHPRDMGAAESCV